jgi:hypothetical protein
MELDKQIDEYLNNKENAAKDRDYFYVSEVGYSKKDIYNSMKNKVSKKFDARVKRILDNGNYMHSRYYKYFLEMGILIAAEIRAVNNNLFHGYADAIISNEGELWVVDLKSCSQWVFNKLDNADDVHKFQLLLYMYYLNISRGMVLYENKDNQTIKIFKIEMTEENKKICEKIISEFMKLKEQINNNIEPEDKNILENIEYGI